MSSIGKADTVTLLIDVRFRRQSEHGEFAPQ
jgi:hypothetical protein